MDPNETLRLIREEIQNIEHAEDRTEQAESGAELAEHFKALDAWLTKGGFTPTDWTTEETS